MYSDFGLEKTIPLWVCLSLRPIPPLRKTTPLPPPLTKPPSCVWAERPSRCPFEPLKGRRGRSSASLDEKWPLSLIVLSWQVQISSCSVFIKKKEKF